MADEGIKRGFKMAAEGIKSGLKMAAEGIKRGCGDKTRIQGLNVHDGIKRSLEDRYTNDKSIQT